MESGLRRELTAGCAGAKRSGWKVQDARTGLPSRAGFSRVSCGSFLRPGQLSLSTTVASPPNFFFANVLPCSVDFGFNHWPRLNSAGAAIARPHRPGARPPSIPRNRPLEIVIMNKTILPRLLSLRPCSTCHFSLIPSCTRALSSTSVHNAASGRPATGLSSLASDLSRSRSPTGTSSNPLIEKDMRSVFGIKNYNRAQDEPHETEAERNMKQTYYFHIYATKHNTHITVCTPTREPMKKLSLSTGNIGFKKSNRGTYDAAYQLANYVLTRIVEQGHLVAMRRVEIVLRGFGVGREAVTKVLLGQEGSTIRDRIVAVTDATRLKFGGTRSPKPRRLG